MQVLHIYYIFWSPYRVSLKFWAAWFARPKVAEALVLFVQRAFEVFFSLHRHVFAAWRCAATFFLERDGFLATLPNKSHLCPIMTLNTNMLTENVIVWEVSLGFASFFFQLNVWVIFLAVEWWTGKWTNNPSQIDGSSNCFSKTIANVFPPWHCVNVLHLKGPDQQTAEHQLLEADLQKTN